MALEDLFFRDYADDNDPENENRLRFGRAQTQDLLQGGANDDRLNGPAPGARTRVAGDSSMFGGMNGWAPGERPVDMGEAPAPVQGGTTPMRYTDESITPSGRYPNTFDQLNRGSNRMYDRGSGQELPPAQQRSPEGQRPGMAGSLGQLLGVPQMGSERFSRALAAGLAGMQGNFGLSTFGRGMGSAMQGGQNYEDAERNYGLKAKTQGDLTDYRNRSLDETSRYHTEMLKRGNYLPGTSTDAEGNVVPGMYDTRTGKFTAGPQITPTGRPGAAGQGTALQKNARFYVDNGIAPDLASAVKMLREGVNSTQGFNRLVQAEKKIIMSDPRSAKVPPEQIEAQARRNVQERTGSAGQGSAGQGSDQNDPAGIR